MDEYIENELAEGVPTSDPIDPKEQNMWGMFCHLAALAGYVIPFGNVIGPLVIWLIKKDEFPFVEQEGKEAINFQISIVIYTVVSAFLIFVIIGIFLLIAIGITNLVCIIIATVKTSDGQAYRYPFCIRFIK
jgi:hypothetical protein